MKTRLLITWLVALGLIAAAEVQTTIREHARGHANGVRKEIAANTLSRGRLSTSVER
jgi:hypothetical protein